MRARQLSNDVLHKAGVMILMSLGVWMQSIRIEKIPDLSTASEVNINNLFAFSASNHLYQSTNQTQFSTTTITMSDLQDAPSADFRDDSYVSRQGNKNEPLPVQSDADRVEDPIDENVADTDEQLGKRP